MNWFPEGWNRFLFLEELFSGFHQVTFCRRVSRGYRESPVETLLAPWQALWEKLPGPEPPDLKRDRNCFDWADGLTHDLTRCRYAAPFQDKATGEWFQLADFDEPCVGVQPFARGRMGSCTPGSTTASFPGSSPDWNSSTPKRPPTLTRLGTGTRGSSPVVK